MIYFIQDSITHHIKIGFTDGEAAERLRALQTGNAAGLSLLATLPGNAADEREIHQKFASHRERGEWFRPSPELIGFIIERREFIAAIPLNRPLEIPLPNLPPWPLKIYLAGKISRNDWRHSIVSGDVLSEPQGVNFNGECGYVNESEWPIVEKSIFGEHHFVGPYFTSCDHGCFHGDDTHGWVPRGFFGHGEDVSGGHGVTRGEYERSRLAWRCRDAVMSADVLFAWIDQPDCYGTILEIGMAKAADKHVWIAGPKTYRDMWLVYETANQTRLYPFSKNGPKDVLQTLLEEHRSRLRVPA